MNPLKLCIQNRCQQVSDASIDIILRAIDIIVSEKAKHTPL